METLLLIGGVILLSGGLVMAFRSSSSGAASAYLGASALSQSGRVLIPSSTLLFWAVAGIGLPAVVTMTLIGLALTGVVKPLNI